MILLDTCVIIWDALEPETLSVHWKNGNKAPQTGKMLIFFAKNVSFLTFLLIFCFSGYPKRIKSSLPEGY